MPVTSPSVRERWDELRAHEGPIDPAALDELWSQLETVGTGEILGSWKGFAFATGHPLQRRLDKTRWHGKRFSSVHAAQPLICADDNGELFSDVKSGNGEASLWNVEFRGEVTATMVYDGMPVFDHFKRLDADTLMGIMNGKPELVLADGRHFYFGLERE